MAEFEGEGRLEFMGVLSVFVFVFMSVSVDVKELEGEILEGSFLMGRFLNLNLGIGAILP